MASSRYEAVRERLPTPVGKQADVVSLAPSGHHVVLGTAGSGKTTMAMLRAMFLADPNTRIVGGGPSSTSSSGSTKSSTPR